MPTTHPIREVVNVGVPVDRHTGRRPIGTNPLLALTRSGAVGRLLTCEGGVSLIHHREKERREFDHLDGSSKLLIVSTLVEIYEIVVSHSSQQSRTPPNSVHPRASWKHDNKQFRNNIYAASLILS